MAPSKNMNNALIPMTACVREIVAMKRMIHEKMVPKVTPFFRPIRSENMEDVNDPVCVCGGVWVWVCCVCF